MGRRAQQNDRAADIEGFSRSVAPFLGPRDSVLILAAVSLVAIALLASTLRAVGSSAHRLIHHAQIHH